MSICHRSSCGAAFSLAIIAGGQSRRMGRDKAFVQLGGASLIEHVMAASADLGQAETLLICNRPADYRHLGLDMHADIHPGKGSLGGIYTALARAATPIVLVLACDMPFLRRDLLRRMIALMDEATDIVAPRVKGYPQALHALYRKTCLPPIAALMAQDRLKIIGFYDQMRVRYLDEADYAAWDPGGRSFTNLNTPEELERARRQLAASRDESGAR